MKRQYSLFFFLLCLMLSSVLNAQEVVNGGFELSNHQGMARNWITDDAKGKFKIALSESEFRSGKRSLELLSLLPSAKTDVAGIAANVYGASSSTKVNAVQLSGWIKSNGKLDTSVALFIQNGAEIIRARGIVARKKGWNKFVLNYTVPEGKAWYRFYYGIELSSSKQVWLDDLKLLVNGKKIEDPNSLYLEPTPKQVEWLSRHISTIAPLSTGKPDQDLPVIANAIGDAKIIGVGEPTHGTSEVTKLKTSLLEYMVKQRGFTTLALEESIATCDQMNRLLHTETPALKDSLLSMPFYKLWKTQEMLDLLVWVNRYNLSHDQKIKFIGIDMEDLGLKNSRGMLRDYGKKNNANIYLQTKIVDKSLDSLILLSRTSMDNDQTVAAANRVKQHLIDLDSLVLLEGKAINKQTAFELSSYVRVCRQWMESKFFMGNRDQFMAENVNIFLESHPDEKIFLWAHNFHVANMNTGGQQTMGGWLKQKHQGDYFPFAITLGGGSYMAASNPSQKSWKSYQLEQPYPGTYEYVFSKVMPDNYFLNLSASIKESAASWLKLPMKQLDLGYIYSGEDHYRYHGTLMQSLDGVFFIRNAGASRSLIR